MPAVPFFTWCDGALPSCLPFGDPPHHPQGSTSEGFILSFRSRWATDPFIDRAFNDPCHGGRSRISRRWPARREPGPAPPHVPEGPVDLLTDEHHRSFPVQVRTKGAVLHAGRDDVIEKAHHVEPDHHERPADRDGSGCLHAGLCSHGQPEEGWTLIDAIQEPSDDRVEPLQWGSSVLRHLDDGFLEFVVHRLHTGTEKVVAIAEVDIDRRTGDSRGECDVVH